MVPPVGGLATASTSTTAAGLVLVVDPCVVGDGRVVEVAAWVKKGSVTRARPVCLSAQEVVDRGGPGDLGTAVGVIRRPERPNRSGRPNWASPVSSAARRVEMDTCVGVLVRFRPER